ALQREEILGARGIQYQPLVVGVSRGQRIQPGFHALQDRQRIGELSALIEYERRVHHGAAIVHLVATRVEKSKRLFVGVERLLQLAKVEIGRGLGLDGQPGGRTVARVQEYRAKAIELGLGLRVLAEQSQAPGALEPTEPTFVCQIVEDRDFDALFGQCQRAREVVSSDIVRKVPQDQAPR